MQITSAPSSNRRQIKHKTSVQRNDTVVSTNQVKLVSGASCVDTTQNQCTMAAEGDDVAGVGMVNNNNSAISVKTETSSNTSGSMSRKKPLSTGSLSNGLAGTSHHINGHGSRDGIPPPPPGNNNHNKQHIPPPPHHMGMFCA